MGVDKEQQVVHRPGAFKQRNKPHKHGQHRSKSQINVANKGKVSLKSATVASRHTKHELNREQRRHQQLQIRQNKRNEVLTQKRRLGGLANNVAPFLVCLVPLNAHHVDADAVLQQLIGSDEQAVVGKSATGVTHVCLPRFKQRFSFIIPSTDNELGILDALKVADTVVFLVTAKVGTDENSMIDRRGQNILMSSFSQTFQLKKFGRQMIREAQKAFSVYLDVVSGAHPPQRSSLAGFLQLVFEPYFTHQCVVTCNCEGFSAIASSRPVYNYKAQNMMGLPTPVWILTDLETVALKRRNEHKHKVQKAISQWLNKEKLMSLENSADGINILRKIGSQKRNKIHHRDHRPHLYAENTEFVPDATGPYGTLQVSGYLRGASLSVNGLVHLPGIGDFQMSQIETPGDPFSQSKNRNSSPTDANSLYVSEPSRQVPLDAECVPDDDDEQHMGDDEQTWPTAEELEMAEKEQKTATKTEMQVKGWSKYQNAWIPPECYDQFQQDGLTDSDEDGDDSSVDDVAAYIDDDDLMDASSVNADSCITDGRDGQDQHGDEDVDAIDDDAVTTVTESELAVNADKYDEDFDMENEKQALAKLRAAAKDELEFPDEVEVSYDEQARVRFQKYRGLESFRDSPWDPQENLPGDYQRLFVFQNFKHAKSAVFMDQKSVEDGPQPGQYITVHLKNVSQLLWANFKELEAPLILFGLLPFEHKMSMVNVLIKRTPNYKEPIKSKDRLVFQCGYRRFAANPIFSVNNSLPKHKFERFLRSDNHVVASFYGRIQFPPSQVLCYKEVNGELVLVATGSLGTCDPNRLVIKMSTLTGYPFKIHKRTATIRFMFFNREDIEYFKAIKLSTKKGRRGHIKEPLGTHGHFKAVFNGQLRSDDVVTLNLYKRVFPKWTYEDLIVNVKNVDKMEK